MGSPWVRAVQTGSFAAKWAGQTCVPAYLGAASNPVARVLQEQRAAEEVDGAEQVAGEAPHGAERQRAGGGAWPHPVEQFEAHPGQFGGREASM